LKNLCEIIKIYGNLHVRLTFKIWVDSLLQDFRSYGGFNLEGAVFSKCAAPHSGKTVRWVRMYFRGARIVQASFVSMPSLVELEVCVPEMVREISMFFVSLTVRLLNDKVRVH